MKAFLNLLLPSLRRTLPTKRRSEASNAKSSWGSLSPEVFMLPAARPTHQAALAAEIFFLEKSQRPFCFLEPLFKPVCQQAAAARVGNEEPPARCGARRGQNGGTVPERSRNGGQEAGEITGSQPSRATQSTARTSIGGGFQPLRTEVPPRSAEPPRARFTQPARRSPS